MKNYGVGSCVSLIMLGWMSGAHAFAPDDAIHIGIEPARVYTQDAAVQSAMAQQRGWVDFLARHGSSWSVRFDERTAIPRRIWGEGLPLIHLDDGNALASEVIDTLRDDSRFLGFDVQAIDLRSARYVPRVDTWYLEWDQLVDNVPVYRGGISARVKHGSLISVGFNTYRSFGQRAVAEVPANVAISTAISEGPAPTSQHEGITSELVWLPVDNGVDASLRLTWKVESETERPVGQWVTFVDAATREVINVHNEVRFLSGTLTQQHHERHPGSALVSSSAPDQWVYTDENEAYTDSSGFFELDSAEDDQKTAELRGKYLRVYNESGTDGRLRFTGATAEWTTEAATQGEIDSFTFLHQIRDWGARIAPEVGMVSNSLRSYVNRAEGSCNAYYNGDVNFFAKEGRCNNTAEIADVNYHEWGHGFHYYSVNGGGGIVDGSVGEGVSDVISILQTKDPVMARYFFTNGNGIRTAANSLRYPEDLVGEVHADGTILSAAVWDLVNLLIEDIGEDAAYETVSRLTAGMLKGGPALDTTFDEIIVADDDDGNLSNGTPHYCQILEAFGNHGLGPGAVSGTIQLAHEALTSVDANKELDIDASLVVLSADCINFEADTAFVQYRVNGGDWTDAPLTLQGDGVEGAIPSQELGAFVEYYIVVRSPDGEVSNPVGSYINPHSFFVGDTLELFCTDFEDSDEQFTHALLSGENTEGADDWQWGSPQGEAGDPASAFSGEYVWGNDLGADNYNGEYQNDKHNRLTSPPYPVGHYEGVFLQYQRWLNVEDGYYDNAHILANDAIVWDNYNSGNQDGGYHHKDLNWRQHSVDLLVEWGTPEVSISWEIISDAGLSMGGWTIDDVCLYAPATPNNRLAVTDFQATDDVEGGITLSWTQPKFAPVERVVVIRNADAYPQGPTDGAVVATISEIELGTAIAVTDTEVSNNTEYYYAVYGYDGADWLGWTMEGWNADSGETFGLAEDQIEFAAGGCSCSVPTLHPTALSGLFGLLLFAAARRRNSEPSS